MAAAIDLSKSIDFSKATQQPNDRSSPVGNAPLT
jgi:hypothetical protein